jgi:23S rRNA pseudouridine2605 synthase
MEERLQKIMAQAGIGSRRACEVLIKQGVVKVNGEVAKLGQKADPAADQIEVRGQQLTGEEDKVYIALYKPRGVLSTAKTPEKVQTVVDLVDFPSRLYPVGRLDRDSEGLILLTNDGNLAYRLSHPKFGHEKTYLVLLAHNPNPEMLETWRTGVKMPDGYKTRPVSVEIIGTKGRGVWLQVRMKEGRKRQIREMARAIRVPVVSIKRTRISTLELGGLKPGEWRFLSESEKLALITSVSDAVQGQDEKKSNKKKQSNRKSSSRHQNGSVRRKRSK